MRIYGITVDTNAIARGLIGMVPDLGESYETALRLGMLPGPLMNSLNRLLGEKFDQIAMNHLGLTSTEPVSVTDGIKIGIDQDKRKGFIKQVSHQVALDMYSMADLVV